MTVTIYKINEDQPIAECSVLPHDTQNPHILDAVVEIDGKIYRLFVETKNV